MDTKQPMNFLQYLNPFREPVKPTALQIAKHDLEEHKSMYLKYKADAEYSAKMATYHDEAASRLARYVVAETNLVK